MDLVSSPLGSNRHLSGVLLVRRLEPASGAVLVDGIDTTTVGLDALRRALAIIPQEPTLFRGTVRDNVDPFGEVRSCPSP